MSVLPIAIVANAQDAAPETPKVEAKYIPALCEAFNSEGYARDKLAEVLKAHPDWSQQDQLYNARVCYVARGLNLKPVKGVHSTDGMVTINSVIAKPTRTAKAKDAQRSETEQSWINQAGSALMRARQAAGLMVQGGTGSGGGAARRGANHTAITARGDAAKKGDVVLMAPKVKRHRDVETFGQQFAAMLSKFVTENAAVFSGERDPYLRAFTAFVADIEEIKKDA